MKLNTNSLIKVWTRITNFISNNNVHFQIYMLKLVLSNEYFCELIKYSGFFFPGHKWNYWLKIKSNNQPSLRCVTHLPLPLSNMMSYSSLFTWVLFFVCLFLLFTLFCLPVGFRSVSFPFSISTWNPILINRNLAVYRSHFIWDWYLSCLCFFFFFLFFYQSIKTFVIPNVWRVQRPLSFDRLPVSNLMSF